jgi:phage tail sheath protein FI
MKRLALRALLIPAYGLAALGTAAAYFHFSASIVAGVDGIAHGRFFLGPALSILSFVAMLALWRMWSIGARLWRHGSYVITSPQDARYDLPGVVAAAGALMGFAAIAKPIHRTEEVGVFGVLLSPAALLALTAFVISFFRSQVNTPVGAKSDDAASVFVARLRLSDLPGIVCGTAIGLLGIYYAVPRPVSGWGPCNWTVFFPLYPDSWPVERPIAFDACDDSVITLCCIGIPLSLVCLVSGATAARIGKNPNAVRAAAAASISVAVVLMTLSMDVLGAPHPQTIAWVHSLIVGFFIVVGAGWLGYVGGQKAIRLGRRGETMPEIFYPGVYVEETCFKAHSIEGVPTSTAAFIGPTCLTPPAPDPTIKPEPLRSFLEFEQQYGGLDDLQTAQGPRCNYIAHAARVFFDNGGQRLYIGQVAPDATAEEYAAALQALPESAGISVIAAPGCSALPAAAEMQRALVEHVSRPECWRFAVLDAPPATTIDDVLAARSGIDSSYAAMYYPWVTTASSVQLPPSGFVCGILARVDTARGVWKAPANETVIGAVDLQAAIDTTGQERLSAQGINCIRSFPSRGILLWGARTTSSDPQWKYVNVRRYFIYLEQSIHEGLQWVVSEPNGEPLWAAVRQTLTNFLLNNWRSGALMGAKPEEAFFVRCDASSMTQNDIDNGRLIVEIGVAPVRPAEFVIIRIGLWTASRCATC